MRPAGGTFVDSNPKGDSRGDFVLFEDRLPTGKRVVGRERGTCFVANARTHGQPAAPAAGPRAVPHPNVFRGGRVWRGAWRWIRSAAIIFNMQRVVVMGRGAAGKSTAAVRLGRLAGLPVIELDKHFWRPGLTPMPPEEWIQLQHMLAARDRWIMDGDLGTHDAPAARLARADTVLIFDFSLARCAWRAGRRSRERADFWWWLLTWRYRGRRAVLHAVATFAAGADVHVLRTPHDVHGFLSTIASKMH